MNNTETRAPALSAKLAAPASASFREVESGQIAAATPRKESERRYVITTSDLLAFGFVWLAICGGLTALIVALGFVFGNVSGADAWKIISACVGGTTLAGIVAGVVEKRSDRPRKPGKSQ